MRISDWSSDVCSSDLFRHPAEYYTNPENSIGYLARIVFRSFSRLLERSTLEHDVSAGQWRFLRQLWREDGRSEEHTSELQSLIRNSYAVFCLKKKIKNTKSNSYAYR